MMTRLILSALMTIALSSFALADNLYNADQFQNLVADNKASRPGDILTVVVYQNTEARNSARKSSGKRSNFDAAYRLTGVEEFGEASLGSNYDGRGEIRRSESFLTSISVGIDEVLSNGDLMISGQQILYINGEETSIEVRGRIRPVDITPENTILSTRIADAQIDYEGKGFVSRSTEPGLLNWLFGILRLGF